MMYNWLQYNTIEYRQTVQTQNSVCTVKHPFAGWNTQHITPAKITPTHLQNKYKPCFVCIFYVSGILLRPLFLHHSFTMFIQGCNQLHLWMHDNYVFLACRSSWAFTIDLILSRTKPSFLITIPAWVLHHQYDIIFSEHTDFLIRTSTLFSIQKVWGETIPFLGRKSGTLKIVQTRRWDSNLVPSGIIKVQNPTGPRCPPFALYVAWVDPISFEMSWRKLFLSQRKMGKKSLCEIITIQPITENIVFRFWVLKGCRYFYLNMRPRQLPATLS